MPCDAIALMNARVERERVQETVKQVQALIAPLAKAPNSEIISDRLYAVTVMLPGNVIAEIKVESDGKVWIKTTRGSYPANVELLQKFVVDALKAKGVAFTNLKYEAHTHENHAKGLAYTQPQAQR